MADPLPWPSVLMPSSEDWSLRGGTRSGGQTFLGNEQIVASPTARWKASLTIPCFKRAQILAMRQVIALGRAQAWYIGPYEFSRAPWNIDFIGGKIVYGKGIDSGQDTSSILDFSLAATFGPSTPTISILRGKGGVLEPGMIFSIGGRLHTIIGLAGESGTPGQQGTPGDILIAGIRPWLRADYLIGTALEFGKPFGLMRLASDDTGAMELQLSRFGTVTVELVEVFA